MGGVAADRRAGRSDTIADREIGHAIAQRFDHANALRTQAARQLEWIETGALIDFDEVEPDRGRANPDLAGSGVGQVDIDPLDHFRPTMLFDPCDACHVPFSRCDEASTGESRFGLQPSSPHAI
jgi:hypothetical protein